MALIACSLPGELGAVEVVKRAQAMGIGERLLVFGRPDRGSPLYRLWRAGALGWVAEDAAAQVIVEAVRAAARGIALWTPKQAAQGQRWWDEVGCKLEGLTACERQVLALVAEGLSNRQIAERLSVSVSTVRTHLRHVFEKLGVGNRVEAAMFLVNEMDINQTTARIIHLDDDTAALM